MFDHDPGTVERARKLRRAMSLPEALLWKHLRGKPLGVKFRNQHPCGAFVADFYCHQARTIIEVDGISHDMGDQPEFDRQRDHMMEASGLKVIRIPASDVLRDPVAVAESIVALCLNTPPPSALRAATSPSGGDFSGALA